MKAILYISEASAAILGVETHEIEVPGESRSVIVPGPPLSPGATFRDAPVFTRYVFDWTGELDAEGRRVMVERVVQ